MAHSSIPVAQLHRLPGWWWRGGEGVGYGRLLGLGSLLISMLALLLLHPAPAHWGLMAGVPAFHLLAVWLSFVLPWQRWSPWALLAFPVLAMTALVVVTVAVPGLAGVTVGFFVLCFAYTGLFLPARGGWVLLLPALATYFGTLRTVTPELAVRTVFVAAAWLVLAELLGRLQRRQLALIGQLRADNQTDPLTGLANRRGMERFLAEAEQGDVLIVFDLDNFKRLNDELGHAAGDLVLQAFGRVLLQQVRTRDRVARSGGEEMVALLRCGESRCGETVTRRLRTALRTACPGVTFSAGMTVVRAGQAVHDALEDADRAMYAAKRAGRDQLWLAGDPVRGERDVALVGGTSPASRPDSAQRSLSA
ncbi:MAG: putative Diguanylate cyclase [Modestobacter sp.]|nr:putative Diguanylate cyclase [Modestobacter sp.]